jgi:hypothetical protein
MVFLDRIPAHIAAVEDGFAGGRFQFPKNLSVNQPGALCHVIKVRLREPLTFRTLAAGTVMIANYMLVATFLNSHRSLLLIHWMRNGNLQHYGAKLRIQEHS